MLDFRTYVAPNQDEEEPTTKEQQNLWKTFDRNNIPGDERLAMCYSRGLAVSVFQWIRKWCTVKKPDGEIIDDLPSKYMVNLLRALLAYKAKAISRKLDGAPHCGLSMLKEQVLNVVKIDSLVEQLWKEGKDGSSHSLRLTLDEGSTVQWAENLPFKINLLRKFLS